MTPQEIFDTVAKHLFAQGERAGIVHNDEAEANEGFSCRYRAPGGAVCAVGKLIPDTAYDPRMEGLGVDGLFEAFGASLPRWMRDNYPLLDRLQMVHDQESHWVDDMRMRWELSLAALTFELDDSILPGLSFNRPEGQDA